MDIMDESSLEPKKEKKKSKRLVDSKQLRQSSTNFRTIKFTLAGYFLLLQKKFPFSNLSVVPIPDSLQQTTQFLDLAVGVVW